MADEIKNLEEEQVPANAEEAALLKEYKKLQENSVPKEQYQKDIAELKEKNAMYLKAITEGSKVDSSEEEDSGSVQDAIADLSKFKGTNLEYWQKATKAIDKVVKSTPKETLVNTVGSDGLDELLKVGQTMKQMVEDANGDPDYFRTLYAKRVQDSAPAISAEINKAGGLVDYFQKKMKK